MSTDAVGELPAKQAITDVIHRYCRAIDRMDRELGESVWHADGTADYGSYQGTGGGVYDYVWPLHERLLGHMHRVTNITIELDGDRAASETYVVATLWGRSDPDGGTDIHVTEARGRYLDRWSCRDGVWAIDHRRFVEELTVTAPLTSTPIRDPATTDARRDRTDLSYEMFDSVRDAV